MSNKLRYNRTDSRLQKKILKRVNPFNIGTFIFSVCTGYMIVSFFSFTGNGSNANIQSLGNISQSAMRLADSFEYYNQKRFYSVGSSPSQ